MMMLELCIAVQSQTVNAALLSHIESDENKVSFSVLPLREHGTPLKTHKFELSQLQLQ